MNPQCGMCNTPNVQASLDGTAEICVNCGARRVTERSLRAELEEPDLIAQAKLFLCGCRNLPKIGLFIHDEDRASYERLAKLFARALVDRAETPPRIVTQYIEQPNEYDPPTAIEIEEFQRRRRAATEHFDHKIRSSLNPTELQTPHTCSDHFHCRSQTPFCKPHFMCCPYPGETVSAGVCPRCGETWHG